jgi:hypothetical protein
VAHLHSVLILGSDAVAAASPATPVQLVHACHRWGFSSVVPASWGDELLAGEVIRRCASRENRPAIQCSCPRVAERLGAHAAKLDDSIFWLATPPVAAAQYIRAHSSGADIHITYAGACPGAMDSSIDQRITPVELLLAISSRGIEVAAQPTVFENIIPPDRRRYFSAAAGSPDPQRLWETAAFRVAQPADIDLSIGVAQLLLGDDRVLIDMAPSVGCICRTTPTMDHDPGLALRSPTPVVHDGVVDVVRSAPALTAPENRTARRADFATEGVDEAVEATRPASPPRRPSQGKAVFRRQIAWRRQTPRPGIIVARTSAVMVAVPESRPLLQRTEVRMAIATAVAVATQILGFWLGRRTPPGAGLVTGAAAIDSPRLLSRSRLP